MFTLEQKVVSIKAAMILRKIGYKFDNTPYWYTDKGLEVRTIDNETGWYLLSADVPTCKISDAQVWLQENCGVSVEPQLKAVQKTLSKKLIYTYDINYFDLFRGVLIDSDTISDTNYQEALKKGLDKVCAMLN